jgi:hypothetical protein
MTSLMPMLPSLNAVAAGAATDLARFRGFADF